MSGQSQSTQALVNYVQSSKLLVKHLQSILRAAGLPSSGIKKTLQDRLVDKIHDLSRRNDQDGLDKLRSIIYKQDSMYVPPVPATAPVAGRASGYSTSPNAGDGPYYNHMSPYGGSSQGFRPHFKSSPFYTILQPLSTTEQCPALSHNRNTVSVTVILTEHQCRSLQNNKNIRIMLYCGAVEPSLSQLTKIDIGFPQQIEVKVNHEAVPVSQLRGLKGKPGSTRPPDITNLMTKAAGYRNEISLTYAQTNKKYAFLVNLVSLVPVEKLVEDLKKTGRRISKQTVIDDMIKRNEDSDLVATSSVMSLKCPLSTLRIVTPVRSSICTHVQCFDLASFLQLQQQAPTWNCPTCNKAVPFEMLVIDSYVQDILESTPKAVDSVTVDPNGVWSVAAQRSPSPDLPQNSDDEDVIEIHDNGSGTMKILSTPHPATSNGRHSKEDTASRSSSKRPAAQVIDLTLSDDESPRPSKRANTQSLSTSNGHDSRSFHRGGISLPLLGLNNGGMLDSSDLL